MPIQIGAQRAGQAASKAHKQVGVCKRAGEQKQQATLATKQMMWSSDQLTNFLAHIRLQL